MLDSACKCRPYCDARRRRTGRVPDIGSPAGFDVATVLTGSGVTLLLSAGIMRYGDRLQYTSAELYGISGVVLIVVGVLIGLALVATGNR